MARKLGPNAKLPTVDQICKRLSVSRSTLDRVLRALESERVLICRHGSGIYVSPLSNQRKIGVVFGANIHDASNYSQFWSLLHNAAMRKAEGHGDELRSYFGCPSLEDEKADPATFSLQDDLESKRLNAIITLGTDAAQRNWLRKWSVPLVSFGAGSEANAAVVFDFRQGLRCAFEGLRRAGCRRVAVVSNGAEPADFATESDEKTVAFREIAAEVGIEYHPSLRWFENTLPQGVGWETHEDAGGKLIRLSWPGEIAHKPDGLFFTDDTSAHGGLIALLRLGVVIGRDVQVAVQTNKGSTLLMPFYQEVIRVQIDAAEIVDDLFLLLSQLLQSGTVLKSPLIIKPELIMPTGE